MQISEHHTPIRSKSRRSFIPPVSVVQKKLAIGASNDLYEVEADRMADRVVSMSDPEVAAPKQTGALIQCKCTACEQDEKLQKKALAESVTPLVQKKRGAEAGGVASHAISQQIQSSRGGGGRMDNQTQNYMESRFGSDFSGVNIHTGSQAIQMSRNLNAQAFTVGNDIYFNEGKYNPNSTTGKHLLAHELTHTLQQVKNAHIQTRRLRIYNRENPKVVLYQLDDRETDEHSRYHSRVHRDASGYFQRLANEKAHQIGAIKLENDGGCINTGANGYESAQHIFNILTSINSCVNGLPIRELHIYSHGFRHGQGVVGSHARRTGLLVSTMDISSARQSGARHVTEFPTQVFAHNATIVLHGCETAEGESSVSEELYSHLTNSIPFSNIAVYGHTQSGDLGNYDRRDWIEFSQENPDGLRTRQRSPYGSRVRSQSISNTQLWNIRSFRRRIRGERTYNNLRNLLYNWGLSLWYSATNEQINNDYNDIPIFEFRGNCLHEISTFNFSNISLLSSERENLLRIFNNASRGLTQINYVDSHAYKRILISGFDPYGNNQSSNPSGMIALALDNESISDSNGEQGLIQSVIFPVSYSYFDQGRIEQFFSPYIRGRNAVDMIMTISQNGSNPNTEVEIYAGRNRSSTATDNEGQLGGGTINSPVVPSAMAPGVSNQFLTSSLPPSIVASNFRDYSRLQSVNNGAVTAIQGSGGGFLSNEIFYRVAALRQSTSSTVPVGHLHIPQLTANTSANRAALIDLVKRLITNALPEI